MRENDEFIKMFPVGSVQVTLAGMEVSVVEERRDIDHHYDCVKGSDGIWRYDRKRDRGRVTGCQPDDTRNFRPLWNEEE